MAENFVVKVTFDNIPQLRGDARRLVQDVIGVAALAIEGEAKVLSPYKTGALRSSIAAKPVATYTWEVAPHKDYAIFQEFGTYKMAAHPYMRPAAEHQKGPFMAAIKAAIDKAIEMSSK